MDYYYWFNLIAHFYCHLPIVTTPSRYTFKWCYARGGVYAQESSTVWSMLGHKSNGKGRMLLF